MKYLLFSGIIVLVFIAGESLKCYQSLGINNPFNEKDLQITCSGTSDSCIRSSNCLSNGSTIDFRGCIKFPSENNSDYNDFIEKLPVDVKLAKKYASYHCSIDFCNGPHKVFEDLNFCNSNPDLSIRSTVFNTSVEGGAESIIVYFTTILTSLLVSICVSH